MTDHETIQELIRLKDQAPIAIDPVKSALLIIDVQRYFARPDYPFAQIFEKLVPGAADGYFERVNSTVLPNIQRLQECFRSHNLPIIFFGAGSYLEDGRDLPEWMKDFDQLGLRLLGQRISPSVKDPSWQIEDSVAPLPGEMVLNKTSSGPLSSTKLDQILHNLGVNSLVVCGLTTAVCVTQTARETADRGFRVIVAEDACTEMSEEMHQAALLTFSYVFGRVRRTEEVVKLFATARAAEVGRDAK
ncbi:MAG: cysteine hydrolase [Pyrinomonadaceae bacterium]|nr:cysteine hydrolase [Pyrinomonadaceae bacterium]